MYPQFLAVLMIYSTLCDRRAGLYGKELRFFTLEHHKSGAQPHSEGAIKAAEFFIGKKEPGNRKQMQTLSCVKRTELGC